VNPQGPRVFLVLGLVVLYWVEGQIAQDFAGGGVELPAVVARQQTALVVLQTSTVVRRASPWH
jgi:hypothetical protein